jgi:hypothetical protein
MLSGYRSSLSPPPFWQLKKLKGKAVRRTSWSLQTGAVRFPRGRERLEQAQVAARESSWSVFPAPGLQSKHYPSNTFSRFRASCAKILFENQRQTLAAENPEACNIHFNNGSTFFFLPPSRKGRKQKLLMEKYI